ncbi:MAG: diguanylate cyclase [Aquificae bacterium]|nr:diguanylate cyclase [Aquificota bacterium]
MSGNRVNCGFYNRLKEEKKLDHDDIKFLMNIVRKELSFLIKHNIPPIPVNYEKWFYIFCSLAEQNKELDDLQLIELYKELYREDYQSIKVDAGKDSLSSEMAEKFKEIAGRIDGTIRELIANLEDHQEKIDSHADRLVKVKKEVNSEAVNDAVIEILHLLRKLQTDNKKLKEELKAYHSELEALKEELAAAKKEASIDLLTGMVNRQRFERAVEDAIKDRKEKGYPASVIIVEVDRIEEVREKYGDAGIDAVLKELAKIFRFYLRANTLVARLGEDKFAILLTGLDREKAEKVGERLRKIIEGRKIKIPSKEGETASITASFGITDVKESDFVESVLIRGAEAVYKAREKGKNRVEVA